MTDPTTLDAATTTWTNWSGAVRSRPRAVVRPTSLEQLAAEVAAVTARGGRARVVGSGHSFTPLVATDDVLFTLDDLAGITEVDAAREQVEVWAGTKIVDLGPPMGAQGLALCNQGDINAQAIAGAMSTGTHGTGITLGSLSTQLVGFTLVTAAGDVLEVDAASHPELFEFGRVSLGALGVLAKLRIQAMPLYKLHEQKLGLAFDELLASAAERRDRYRHFEAYWFPYSDRAQVKQHWITDEPVKVSKLKHYVVDVAIENGVWWSLCKLCQLAPGASPAVSRLAATMLSNGEKVNWAYAVFPTPRLVRFNEMEYAVPMEAGPEALRRIRDFVRGERIAVNYPIEYRYVKGDDIPLSPFYRRDSAVISVHMYRGMPFQQYFDGCERIFRDLGGRPHWGKMHSLSATELRGIYPRFDEFVALRARMDPQGTFSSPYLDKLFGPTAAAATRGPATHAAATAE